MKRLQPALSHTHTISTSFTMQRDDKHKRCEIKTPTAEFDEPRRNIWGRNCRECFRPAGPGEFKERNRETGTSAKHNLCSFIYIITPQSTFATDSGAVGRVGFLYILNILGERFFCCWCCFFFVVLFLSVL